MNALTFGQKIRTFREEILQLSQAQFALLVGMGVASINRLENERGGAVTPAHRLLLEGLQEPSNLIRALEGKEDELGEGNFGRLKRVAEQLLRQEELKKIAQYQLLKWSEETAGRDRFELEKLIEMVKFFSAEGEWKTKLNKLLFYSDFLAFRELKSSISGTRYVIGNFGPIPDRQDALYSALTEAGAIEAREDFVASNGQPIEKLFARGQVDRRRFKPTELRILERVKSFFMRMTAKQIADYSHEECFYQEGQLGEAIPYSESKKIKEVAPLASESESAPTLGELAARISSKVPMKEWKKLPSDGSQNIDHYLYGAPKRK